MLVGLGREVVPDLAAHAVGADRSARVGADQRDRHANVGRQVVVLEEVVPLRVRFLREGEQALDIGAIRRAGLEIVPVGVVHRQRQHRHAARARRRRRRRGGRRCGDAPVAPEGERLAGRLLARMADRAMLQEHVAARRHVGRMGRKTRLAIGRGGEFHRLRRRRAALGDIGEEGLELRDAVGLCGLPIDRFVLDRRQLERPLRLEADDRVVHAPPLFRVRADVEVHARQRALDADAVRAVEQHARRVARVGVHQRLVLDAALSQVGRALLFGQVLPGAYQARLDLEDRGDRVRVVDVIGADQRRVDRAGLLAGHELPQEALGGLQVGEGPLRRPVLVADGAGHVGPAGRLRIRRRVQRVGPDVAEGAGHADTERPHELRIGMHGVVGVVGVARGIDDALLPVVASRLRGARVAEEVRVGQQPQAHHAARVAIDARVDAVLGELGHRAVVQGHVADGEEFLVGDALMAGRCLDRFGELVGGRVDVAGRLGQADLVAVGLVEVEAQDLLRRIGLRTHARLVHQPGIVETVGALARVDEDQEVGQPVAVLLQPAPEGLVALAPEHPGVLAADRRAGVVRHGGAVGPVQRVQRAIGAGHLVHVAEEIAHLGREAHLRASPQCDAARGDAAAGGLVARRSRLDDIGKLLPTRLGSRRARGPGVGLAGCLERARRARGGRGRR